MMTSIWPDSGWGRAVQSTSVGRNWAGVVAGLARLFPYALFNASASEEGVALSVVYVAPPKTLLPRALQFYVTWIGQLDVKGGEPVLRVTKSQIHDIMDDCLNTMHLQRMLRILPVDGICGYRTKARMLELYANLAEGRLSPKRPRTRWERLLSDDL